MTSADSPTQPGGNYRPALITEGPVLHLAGQTARRGEGMVATGIVGETVDVETARRCARRCAENLLRHADSALGGLERIRQVARVTVYIATTPEFHDLSPIGDAASDHFVEQLGPRGRHVRSTIGVASLPRRSPVEIDASFELLN